MCEIENVKAICEKNKELEDSLKRQTQELCDLEKREQTKQLELQRLRNCELELSTALEKNKLKEEKILELLKQNSDLEAFRLSTNDHTKKTRLEFEEKLEQLTNENALLQNEKSSLQAQLISFKEENINESKIAIEEVVIIIKNFSTF
jgi:hypothetical protein